MVVDERSSDEIPRQINISMSSYGHRGFRQNQRRDQLGDLYGISGAVNTKNFYSCKKDKRRIEEQ